jgi:hypothetical protein
MEPPIGYGSTHRSISPESQFGTVARSNFFDWRSGEVQNRTGTRGRRQAGGLASLWPFLARPRGRMTKIFRRVEDANHLGPEQGFPGVSASGGPHISRYLAPSRFIPFGEPGRPTLRLDRPKLIGQTLF